MTPPRRAVVYPATVGTVQAPQKKHFFPSVRPGNPARPGQPCLVHRRQRLRPPPTGQMANVPSVRLKENGLTHTSQALPEERSLKLRAHCTRPPNPVNCGKSPMPHRASIRCLGPSRQFKRRGEGGQRLRQGDARVRRKTSLQNWKSGPEVAQRNIFAIGL